MSRMSKVQCPTCKRRISKSQIGRHMQIHGEQSKLKPEPESDYLLAKLPTLDEDRMTYLRSHLTEPRTRLAKKLGIRKVHLIQIMLNEGIIRGGEGA